ncbi:aminopeptidase [Massilia sp. TS11]|nr:aminopeptidase [Massilia sp. TS11]
MALLAEARPIDDWLADSKTDPQLKHKLAQARRIRDFAVQVLALPDNASYRRYAALPRRFVVWNVVAAPELSLQPLQWCFPVAGCVSYRGYYSKEAADAYAQELRAEGFDVQVGGVSAYSTLGWFNDPLLSTFIDYPEAELARLVFHELAHQVAYAPGDPQFNEGFATAVEEVGVQRWLDLHGTPELRAAYARHDARRHDWNALLLDSRRALAALYAAPGSDADKRAGKARLFAQLQQNYQALKQRWGGYAGYDRWFAEPLSNAHLAAVATYADLVPALRALLARSPNLAAFYRTAQELATRDKDARHAYLNSLLARAPDAATQHVVSP